MTTNGRGGQRVPSRTPPFVLVGLLVVFGFMGYSYYSLSSTNSDLSSQLEAVRLEKRDTEGKHSVLEKTLTSAKSHASTLESEVSQLKKDIQVKETEIQSLNANIAQKVADDEKQKSLMERCDEKLSVVQKDLESANAEKSNLQHTLDAEREKTAVCGMEACQAPVQQVLTVASKLIGSAKMQNALGEAQLDAEKLMNGIFFPEPVDQKPQEQPKLESDKISDKMPETKQGNPEQQDPNMMKPAKDGLIQAQQPNEVQPDKSQVDNAKDPQAEVVDIQNLDGSDRKVVPPGQDAAFDNSISEARHQGVPDDETQIYTKEKTGLDIAENKVAGAVDLGSNDKNYDARMQKNSEVEQGHFRRLDLTMAQQQANILKYDKSEQVDASEGQRHKQMPIMVDRSQVDSDRAAFDFQAIPGRSDFENHKKSDNSEQAGLRGGENQVHHFETGDKADPPVNLSTL